MALTDEDAEPEGDASATPGRDHGDMSTDLHDRATKPSDEGPDRPEKPRPALSVTQVVGGALAAMTAAALGSRLSVAGTLVGAALASVVAAVAGSVYTTSLRRTSQHVTRVIASRNRSVPSTPDRSPARADGEGSPTATQAPVVGPETRTGRGWDGATTDEPTEPAAATAEPPTEEVAGPRRRLGWKPVVLGAVLMFAIAAVALTSFELVTGQALSGGSGTTVGRVAEGRTDPTPSPSATPSATPTASESPSTTASAEPSPSASATPSDAPSATPSASGSPTPSAGPTPTASATPATPGAVPTA